MSYPASKNKRKHPRFEPLAFVELRREKETVVLPVRNLSLGGISVNPDGHDLGRFSNGMIIDLAVFDAQDETTPPVRSPARVMRHDPDGSMALMWNATDPRVAEQLALLLDKLPPGKK